MAIADLRDRFLELPAVYAIWQAPFAARKFAPVERRLRQRPPRRVLDVGCGTGTNAGRFRGTDYVGLDINEQYLERARRRYPGRFVQADLTAADLTPLGVFDTVLVNSFLHHVSDDDVRRILAQVATALAPDGRVYVLELVLPERASFARLMARLDRGRFARPFERWSELFEEAFDPVTAEPYTFGGPLWAMIYFEGRRRA